MKKLCAISLLLAFLLCGCAQNAPVEREIFAMDTLMTLRVWGDDDDVAAAVSEINRLDALLSVTDENSEIYALNRDGTAEFSLDTFELLNKAVAVSRRTDGAFDPTVYPLVEIWGFTKEEQRVPSQGEIDAALSRVGYEQLERELDVTCVSMDGKIDLGGIAKGYAAQKVVELLQSRGIETAFLSLGGNVQTLGSKPDGAPWLVGIADPSAPSQAIACLRFHDSLALVTSGGYQRYFEENGVRYHHILDPKTGYPADSGLASVTVLAHDGALADGLSTALFVMGMEKATALWRESDDFEAVFITKDGAIFATDGAASLLTDCECTVIER
ncbi:MAG: FAD:protein FMN transferase [Oscillospiraceae bacterium]|nr:FAD:protein FMN transferase [Oscillospiraceae bacterium]